MSELVKERIFALRGKRFDFEGKTHHVTAVELFQGKYHIKTDLRVFVKDVVQAEGFLERITGVYETAVMLPDQADMQRISVVTEGNAGLSRINNNILRVMDDIMADPSAENLKKGAALAQLGNTAVSLGQMQVNFLKVLK